MKNRIKLGAAAMLASAGLAAGLAVPAQAQAPQAVSSSVNAAASTKAVPGGYIKHHPKSRSQYLVVLGNWAHTSSSFPTYYSGLKAKYQPKMIARGTDSGYWNDTDGYWVPANMYAIQVTGQYSGYVVASGGSIGRAVKISSISRSNDFALCWGGTSIGQCLGLEYS